MEKNKKKKKEKINKRKIIVITILFLLIMGIFLLVNKFIPIKNINKDDITLIYSTTKPTNKNVIVSLSTKSNYNIFYFIDYSNAEEQYYNDTEFSKKIEIISESQNDSNTISNNTNEQIYIKQISDNEYRKVENSKIDIENNCLVYLKYERFGKLSNEPYVFEISNIDKEGPEIGEIEVKSDYSSITLTVNALDNTSTNLQYYYRLAPSNTYISAGSKNTYTFSELTPNETYTIFVKTKDKFGNESEAVTEATTSLESQEEEKIEKKNYHFKVNITANTVTVYDKDDNGDYTKPIKAFICSTGKSTPKSGTYKISDRYRWRSLFGNVFGQYAVRIYGNILFHSVPYEQMYANTLEYDEFDKLGTSASLGCVRLCVKDAKWIYDNAKTGSTVQFYSDSSNPGPLGKPKIQKISDNKEFRNWDPTDPDKHNPWLGGDGKITKTKIVNDNDDTKTTSTPKESTSNTTNSDLASYNNENTIVWHTDD